MHNYINIFKKVDNQAKQGDFIIGKIKKITHRIIVIQGIVNTSQKNFENDEFFMPISEIDNSFVESILDYYDVNDIIIMVLKDTINKIVTTKYDNSGIIYTNCKTCKKVVSQISPKCKHCKVPLNKKYSSDYNKYFLQIKQSKTIYQ